MIAPANDMNMLNGIKIIDLQAFEDERGFFMEAYNARVFQEKYGITASFVQDNHSFSKQHVLRGLHYQITKSQGKLIRVLTGAVFDVVVDLRKNSSTLGRWLGLTLHAEEKKAVWIPPGFAHGFLVLSPTADFLYKTTDYYDPRGERCLRWNDPTVGIAWPLQKPPLLSLKDQQGKSFAEAELFP
jgi:dTDP-4-dehydrorhamnose 3,5-epimerase